MFAAKAGIAVTTNLDSKACGFDEYRDTIPFLQRNCICMTCLMVRKSKIQLYDTGYILMNNPGSILLLPDPDKRIFFPTIFPGK